jgi:hypothetical protein
MDDLRSPVPAAIVVEAVDDANAPITDLRGITVEIGR